MKAQITTTYEIDELSEFIEYVEYANYWTFITTGLPLPYQFDRIFKGKRSEMDWMYQWNSDDDSKKFQANTVVEILK